MARGAIGPDLTHIGSRATLAAGTLRNTPDAIARFVVETEHLKPGLRMPSFAMLPREEVAAIAAYLGALE